MEGMAANRRTRGRTPLLMAAVAGALFLALLGTVGYALLGDLWPRDSAPPRSEALARAARAAVLDVRGTEREEAERVLRSAGFRVAAEYKESAEEDEGEVIAQHPRGGEEALRGSTVTITVGEGPDTTAEPHLKAPRAPEAAPHQKDATIGAKTGSPGAWAPEGPSMRQAVLPRTKMAEEGAGASFTDSSRPEPPLTLSSGPAPAPPSTAKPDRSASSPEETWAALPPSTTPQEPIKVQITEGAETTTAAKTVNTEPETTSPDETDATRGPSLKETPWASSRDDDGRQMSLRQEHHAGRGHGAPATDTGVR
jgi:eukaryotic-like serine/threonine-protein kinase